MCLWYVVSIDKCFIFHGDYLKHINPHIQQVRITHPVFYSIMMPSDYPRQLISWLMVWVVKCQLHAIWSMETKTDDEWHRLNKMAIRDFAGRYRFKFSGYSFVTSIQQAWLGATFPIIGSLLGEIQLSPVVYSHKGPARRSFNAPSRREVHAAWLQ